MLSAAIFRITLNISTKYYISLYSFHLHINYKLENNNLSWTIFTKDDKGHKSIDLQRLV